MWTWAGELEVRGRGFIPRSRVFVFPGNLDASRDLSEAVRTIVDAYNGQTDGTRFKVVTSSVGLHIVPFESRDQGDAVTTARSVLDSYVTVPVAARTATEHFEALCAA